MPTLLFFWNLRR